MSKKDKDQVVVDINGWTIFGIVVFIFILIGTVVFMKYNLDDTYIDIGNTSDRLINMTPDYSVIKNTTLLNVTLSNKSVQDEACYFVNETTYTCNITKLGNASFVMPPVNFELSLNESPGKVKFITNSS